MTTDEVNEDEVFTALVKHRLSGIDPKYVPDDAVANIADAYTEWRSAIERAAAEKALTDAAEQFATHDGIEALMFAHDDVTAVQATEKWLIDRAAALGLTAGQEGKNDGAL